MRPEYDLMTTLNLPISHTKHQNHLRNLMTTPAKQRRCVGLSQQKPFGFGSKVYQLPTFGI